MSGYYAKVISGIVLDAAMSSWAKDSSWYPVLNPGLLRNFDHENNVIDMQVVGTDVEVVAIPRIVLPLVATPASVPADGVTVCTISGFPATRLEPFNAFLAGPVQAQYIAVDDTTVEFTFDTPGTYEFIVQINDNGYFETKVIIDVTP